MLYPIGPDGPVNQGYANFNEKVWMSMVHVPRFGIRHQNLPYDFQKGPLYTLA